MQGSSGFQKQRRLAACLVFSALVAGCRTLDLSVHNLREVHEPDGTPRRRGDLHSPIEHILKEAMTFGEFGAPTFMDGDSLDRIEDPIGTCHENLTALLDEDLDDPRVLGYTVEIVTWLAGDCTYVISRERCAEVLLRLGRRLDVSGPITLSEEATPASAQDVALLMEDLLRGVKTTFSGTLESEAQLEDVAGQMETATLDREGARRCLAVTNILLANRGFHSPDLARVRQLHNHLARLCVQLTLGQVLAEEEPLVRAAGYRTWIGLSESVDPAPFESAWRDGHPQVLLEAVRAIAISGTPISETASSSERATAENYWIERLLSLLSRILDGPMQVAACRAMGRLTGEEPNLHPEYWVGWWDDIQAGAEIPEEAGARL